MHDANALLDLLGGTNKVARLLHITPASVSQWRTRQLIPDGQLVKLAAKIEEASGGEVTRQALFPGAWAMIWPELNLVRVRPRKAVAERRLH